MEHQVAITAICAASPLASAQFVISQKAMRMTLYLVAIPATLSVAAIIAEFLQWRR